MATMATMATKRISWAQLRALALMSRHEDQPSTSPRTFKALYAKRLIENVALNDEDPPFEVVQLTLLGRRALARFSDTEIQEALKR